jgi:hypothetical protein
VGSRTSIPVPKVIAWSSDASNPVGSEYLLMEKARGIQLADVWGDMNQLNQFKLIQCLTQLDSQLALMKFPAYGNLYFRDAAPRCLSPVVRIDDEYCIGPAYNASWFPRSGNEQYAGPCMTSLNRSSD